MTSPHALFFQLCAALSFDDSVLLDWLIHEKSSTRFTEYMTKYVTLAATHFPTFKRELNPTEYNIGVSSSHCVGKDNTGNSCAISPVRLPHAANCKSITSTVSNGLLFLNINSFPHHRISSTGSSNILPLVEYSSSEDDEKEGLCEELTKSSDDTISCLIRLHLKLERMEANELLPVSLESLCEALDHFEKAYES